jgi:hypothetical protein
MLILLEDARHVPTLFDPFGAIPEAELAEWLQQNGIALPRDLLVLWQLTGGGDVFETETMLRPTVPSIPTTSFLEDDIEGCNARHSAKGKPSEFFIFQHGCFLSAVDLSDQRFVTLSEDYAVKGSSDSLDDWYVHTLRTEFGRRYGLGPVGGLKLSGC